MAHDTHCIERVNTPCIATQCIAVDMSASTKADRLRQARQSAKFSSASEAAERFGWTVSAYRHHENGTRNFGPDQARKYGRAFKVKAGWLLGLDGVSEPLGVQVASNDMLGVAGSVAAGVWRESDYWNDDRRFVIHLPSPIPGAERFGFVVEGQSMNLVYQPGSVLDCISIFSNDVKPKNGDHVIVERVRPDGLRELTVKEYREEGGRYLLVPRSSQAEFKPIDYPGPDDRADPTAETVRVIAFVVTHYPPERLDLLRRFGLVTHPAEASAAE